MATDALDDGASSRFPHAPSYERAEESEAARLDRNYSEILQELRVAEAGVQILFGFLLALAFTQRFTHVSAFEKDVYFVSLLLSAAAGGLLMAPAAMHRIMFRRGLKDVLVTRASTMALAGVTVLGFAVVGSVLLVSDVLFGHVVAALTTVAMASWLGLLWFAFPLRIRALSSPSADRSGGKGLQ
ncbi:MAG TPA: DUF6328 family protein [Acidimicrobiales bacterium]|nr:DUF6328 family protein [Acidimicrobiales bacterium]